MANINFQIIDPTNGYSLPNGKDLKAYFGYDGSYTQDVNARTTTITLNYKMRIDQTSSVTAKQYTIRGFFPDKNTQFNWSGTVSSSTSGYSYYTLATKTIVLQHNIDGTYGNYSPYFKAVINTGIISTKTITECTRTIAIPAMTLKSRASVSANGSRQMLGTGCNFGVYAYANTNQTCLYIANSTGDRNKHPWESGTGWNTLLDTVSGVTGQVNRTPTVPEALYKAECIAHHAISPDSYKTTMYARVYTYGSTTTRSADTMIGYDDYSLIVYLDLSHLTPTITSFTVTKGPTALINKIGSGDIMVPGLSTIQVRTQATFQSGTSAAKVITHGANSVTASEEEKTYTATGSSVDRTETFTATDKNAFYAFVYSDVGSVAISNSVIIPRANYAFPTAKLGDIYVDTNGVLHVAGQATFKSGTIGSLTNSGKYLVQYRLQGATAWTDIGSWTTFNSTPVSISKAAAGLNIDKTYEVKICVRDALFVSGSINTERYSTIGVARCKAIFYFDNNRIEANSKVYAQQGLDVTGNTSISGQTTTDTLKVNGGSADFGTSGNYTTTVNVHGPLNFEWSNEAKYHEITPSSSASDDYKLKVIPIGNGKVMLSGYVHSAAQSTAGNRQIILPFSVSNITSVAFTPTWTPGGPQMYILNASPITLYNSTGMTTFAYRLYVSSTWSPLECYFFINIICTLD